MDPWHVSMGPGKGSTHAAWHGPADGERDAKAAAIAMLSAIWQVRLGERPSGRPATSIIRKTSGAGGEAAIGLWKTELLRTTAAGPAIPADGDRDAIADAILRLALPHAPAAASGRLTVMTGPTGERRNFEGTLAHQKIPAEAEVLPDDGSRDRTPIPVRAPRALATAMAALAASGGAQPRTFRDIALPASASLRAILRAQAEASRPRDAATVSDFLESLGLGPEAAALRATFAG